MRSTDAGTGPHEERPKRSRLKSIAQRVLFTAERFGEHEMANHAAAGAYAFLLSATPATLLILGLARFFFRSWPRAVASLEGLMTDFLGPLASTKAVETFFASGLGITAIAFGTISLIWAARLFVVTVQRALRLIHSASGRNKPVKENLLTFAIELACLIAVISVFAAAQIAGMLVADAAGPIAIYVRRLVGTVPTAMLLLFVYLTLRYIPAERPRRKTSLLAAVLCVGLYALFARAMGLFTNGTRYELLYGVFGSLIILLVKVYTFFTLYLYCAEFSYVVDHFDALLFGRFYSISRKAKIGRVDRGLFMSPERLFRSFGIQLRKGENIFRAGDTGKSVYFICDGEIGIYIGSGPEERRIAVMEKGNILGEMAAILDEVRTATARAERDSILLELPPEIFDLFLRSDSEASRRLIDSLSSRIKNANNSLAKGEIRAKEAEAQLAASRRRDSGREPGNGDGKALGKGLGKSRRRRR